MQLFADRQEAGRELAKRLLSYSDQQPVIIAIPRGGVVGGFLLYLMLKFPLYIKLFPCSSTVERLPVDDRQLPEVIRD